MRVLVVVGVVLFGLCALTTLVLYLYTCIQTAVEVLGSN